MNNHEYSQQYMQAMEKLHGTGKQSCQHPACNRITLQTHCDKHRPDWQATTQEKNTHELF